MLANAVVGGLALFSLILLTTVVVFGIKFVLDRNPREEKPAPAEVRKSEPSESAPEPSKPLYVMKQPPTPRKKRTRTKAQYAVLDGSEVYTLEPVREKEKEKERAAS